MVYNYESIIDSLNNLRGKYGWTDVWLSNKIGLHRHALKKIIDNKRGSFSSLVKIVNFLKESGVKIDSFEFKGIMFQSEKNG